SAHARGRRSPDAISPRRTISADWRWRCWRTASYCGRNSRSKASPSKRCWRGYSNKSPCRAEPRASNEPPAMDKLTERPKPRTATHVVPTPRALAWVGGLLGLAVLSGPLPELTPLWLIGSGALLL